MTFIRINMVINCDEHPDLYELLSNRSAKVRASIIRNYAEFGLWTKRSGDRNVINEPVQKQITIPAKVEADDNAPVQISRPTVPRKSKPTTSVSQEATTSNKTGIDMSVLSGMNLDDI